MNTKGNPTIRAAATAARKASRDAEIRSGIKRRAVTFPNRKAVASRKACRGPLRGE